MSQVIFNLLLATGAVGCAVWIALALASTFAKDAPPTQPTDDSTGNDVWPPPPQK